MHAIVPRRVPPTAFLLGIVLLFVLTAAILFLKLEMATSLVAAAVGFAIGGMLAGQRDRHDPWAITMALTGPTLLIYAVFAVNAASPLLLSVPGVAVVASAAGVILWRRYRSAPAATATPH